MEKIYLPEQKLVSAVISCLEVFAQHYAQHQDLDENIVSDIVENLLASININLGSQNIAEADQRVETIAELYESLTQWVALLPNEMLKDKLIKPVLDLIQITLNTVNVITLD